MSQLDGAATTSGSFRPTDDEDELHSANLKLKLAQIKAGISGISKEWDASMQSHANIMANIDEHVDKQRGSELSNIQSMEKNPTVRQVDSLEKEFERMNGGVDYDAEPYTFRIPSLTSQVCKDERYSVWCGFSYRFAMRLVSNFI